MLSSINNPFFPVPRPHPPLTPPHILSWTVLFINVLFQASVADLQSQLSSLQETLEDTLKSKEEQKVNFLETERLYVETIKNEQNEKEAANKRLNAELKR